MFVGYGDGEEKGRESEIRKGIRDKCDKRVSFERLIL